MRKEKRNLKLSVLSTNLKAGVKRPTRGKNMVYMYREKSEEGA